MKLSRKLFIFAMVLCLVLSTSVISFAAEKPDLSSKSSNYMNYDFPDDAVILYQSEDGVVYQSKKAIARTTYHNSKTVNGGIYEQSSFSITNPHTIINSTNGIFRVESNYSGASVDMLLTQGTGILTNHFYVHPSDGDVHFSFKSHTKNLTVVYTIQGTKSGSPITMHCYLS